MANYKPPRENESSGEFWQRLREMAKTLEQDDPSGSAAKTPVAFATEPSQVRLGAVFENEHM